MNEALRRHVTRIGFDLQLAKSHIAALVYLNEVGRRRWNFAAVHAPRGYLPAHGRAFGHFATGALGLETRGLIEHHPDSDGRAKPTWQDDGTMDLFSADWTITRAGRLVIDLLKESGLYDEFAQYLIFRDEPRQASR
jgi:hypothetical protein